MDTKPTEMFDISLLDRTTALDSKDVRDFKYDEVFGEMAGALELPAKFKLSRFPTNNQWKTMFCTAYSGCNAVNENQAREGARKLIPVNSLPKTLDPVEVSAYGVRIGKLNPEWGGYINWVLEPFRDVYKIISWFAVVENTVDALKRAIWEKGQLITGSNTISWRDFDAGWVAKYTPNSPWHAFSLCGWDDTRKVFIVENSWSQYWGDAWYFYIRYEDIGKMLFSTYAMTDADDTRDLLWVRATKRGLVNGTGKEDACLRLHALYIIGRWAWNWWGDETIANFKKNGWYDIAGRDPMQPITVEELKGIFNILSPKKTVIWNKRGDIVQSLLS